MKLINILIFSLCFCTLSYSQDSEIGNWLMYFGNQKINSKWNWHNEVQYRSYDFIGDTQQFLLRTGIGYNLTENNNNILLGYAFINSYKYLTNSDKKTESNENRIFQQFITRQYIGRTLLQHRYRIEERFISDDFKMRFRYQLGINIALNKKTFEKHTLYFAASDEVFINAESPIFDQNRLYGAVGYFIDKHFKIEAGFMAQTFEHSNRNQFQISVFNNLPF